MAKKQQAQKANPKAAAEKKPERAPKRIEKPQRGAAGPKAARGKAAAPRNYFTVHEDNTILEGLKRGGGGGGAGGAAEKTKFEVARELAERLGRSTEAVRDRIKRYLAKLAAADQKDIAKHAKASPRHFAYFKRNPDGSRKLEKVAAASPSLQNREFKRRARAPKPKKEPKRGLNAKNAVPKKRPNPEKQLAWVGQKLKDKDQFFRLDFGANLLSDVLNELINDHGVALADVKRLVAETHANTSLEEVFRGLGVKRNNAK